MLLNNEWVKNEIKEEKNSFWKQMKTNSTIQNLWDTAKAVQKGRFIVNRPN